MLFFFTHFPLLVWTREKCKNHNKLNAQFFNFAVSLPAPKLHCNPRRRFLIALKRGTAKNHEKITKTNGKLVFFLPNVRVSGLSPFFIFFSFFSALVYIFNTFCIQFLRLANLYIILFFCLTFCFIKFINMKLAASCGLIRIHFVFLIWAQNLEFMNHKRNLMSSLAAMEHKDTFKMLPNGLWSDVYKYLNLSSG